MTCSRWEQIAFLTPCKVLLGMNRAFKITCRSSHKDHGLTSHMNLVTPFLTVESLQLSDTASERGIRRRSAVRFLLSSAGG